MKYKLALFMMESGLLFYKTCKMLPKGCFDIFNRSMFLLLLWITMQRESSC